MGPPTAILGAKHSHTARYLRAFLDGNGQRRPRTRLSSAEQALPRRHGVDCRGRWGPVIRPA